GRRLGLGEVHGHHGPAAQPRRRAQRPAAGRDAPRGDQLPRRGARHRQLIGEKAVEALGLGDGDAEGDDRRHCSAVRASFARSCARPSSHSEIASAIAPTLMAESATLNVGQRAVPIPTSTKSTTPWALRRRSITFPTAPAHTSASATKRNRSPGRAARTMERSTTRAASASAKKIQREYAPRHSPTAAQRLYTRRSCTSSPITATGACRASSVSARSFVTTSASTTAPAVIQNTRRSAPLAIFFLRLALDAQPRVRQRVQALEADVLAALLALAEALGRLVQAP